MSDKSAITYIIANITRHPPGFYGYVYIAMIPLFSILYWMPGTYLVSGDNRINSITESIYFSVVTITTLGYGDIAPANGVAMLLAGAESLIGITLIGLFLNALSLQHSAEAQKKERKVMRTELREELVEDFERIASDVKSASQEMIKQVTGGDSYPELLIDSPRRESGGEKEESTFGVNGYYPIQDISISIIDQCSLDIDYQHHFLSINPVPGVDGGEINFENRSQICLFVLLYARNGSWIQRIRFEKIGSEWSKANRLTKIWPAKDNYHFESEEVFLKMDDNFPLNEEGEVDWDVGDS